MSDKKHSSHHVAEVIGAGIALTTAAVAALGTFFLYGSKNAAKNRKLVKSWMLKAKAEVLEQLEQAKEITQHEYEQLVEQVVTSYASAETATKKEVKELQVELKDLWRELAKAAPHSKTKAKAKTGTKKKATTATTKAAAKKSAPTKKSAPKKATTKRA